MTTRAELEAFAASLRADATDYRETEDRAAEGLDGMDFGDRCYWGDRADDTAQWAAEVEQRVAAWTYQAA